MSRITKFQFCTVNDERHLPLAIVRFTAYDEDDSLLSVEQVVYENNSDYFQTEVSAALECGVDISILSPYKLQDFKWLNKLVNA